MKLRKINTIFISLAALALPLTSITFPNNVSATANCVSEKCIAAEKAEQEALEKATNASNTAKTLEGEVARLNDEIAAIQARVVANEARAEDLQELIITNTAKLKEQQAALAKMLVETHLDGQPEAIIILAGSNSISDYAEKQSRVDTVKSQINLSAQAVKLLKEELEGQKAEVEGIIADQKLQQTAIAERRNEQNELVTKYKGNAEAYAAEAEEARRIKESEIASEIARYNSIGIVSSGTNSYPWRDQCPAANLSFLTVGGYVCQCTSYAGYKAQERWGVTIMSWGNAYSWGYSAAAAGYLVDSNPAPYTVAVSTEGEWGHVMWVEAVNSDGTIDLSEYNNWYSSQPHRVGDYGFRSHVPTAGLQFIHFN